MGQVAPIVQTKNMNIQTTRKNVSIAHHPLTEAAALTAPRRSTDMAAVQTNVDGVEALL
jgi:glycerate-2-kinase